MAIKEVVTKYFTCDLCKNSVENEKELKNMYLPVKFMTEQTEGRACEPYFINRNFDLCKPCLEKTTVLLGQGAQGYNDFWFKNN